VHRSLREPNGRFSQVDFPNAAGTLPAGINDRGQVVGGYLTATSNRRSSRLNCCTSADTTTPTNDHDNPSLKLNSYPYIAGEGTRLFDDVPQSRQLDLVSSTAFSNETVGLQYRRHR